MINEKPPIYIFGHQNPDIDAICAPIAYAAFKEAIGLTHYIPARCGNTNARIDAILDYFKKPLPVFIGDITPRIGDMMTQDIRTATPDFTCTEALEIIDEHDIRVLPVVNERHHILGAISIFRLGEFFMHTPHDVYRMRRVHTTVNAIVRSLKAFPVHNMVNPDRLEDLFIRVCAMDIRSFGNTSHKQSVEPESSIIIVGDRRDIQEKAIAMGVRLLIISGGLKVDTDIIEAAKQHKINLIVSPYDSATTALAVRSATQINNLYEKDIQIFRPEEKISNVRRKIANSRDVLYYVVDDHEKLVGVFSKSDVLKPSQKKIVLVDHNELSQAVPGASEVEIVEIIDHHRLGNPSTQQPILFRNEPCGSTSTIIATIFRNAGIEPTREIAGLMMSGLIADTLLLKSPTSTPMDKVMLDWLSSIAKIDPKDLSELIFNAGSIILSSTPHQIIEADCKIYQEGNKRFSVSQVEELGFENFWKNAQNIQKALESYRKREVLYFSSILITDINTQTSIFAIDGDEEFIEQIAYPAIEKGSIFDMKNMVSRKKQLIPYLTNLFASIGFISLSSIHYFADVVF